jgi:hypothetical protein
MFELLLLDKCYLHKHKNKTYYFIQQYANIIHIIHLERTVQHVSTQYVLETKFTTTKILEKRLQLLSKYGWAFYSCVYPRLLSSFRWEMFGKFARM